MQYLTGKDYPWLCDACKAVVSEIAALYNDGEMPDTDDEEAPINEAYDRGMLCQGHTCANSMKHFDDLVEIFNMNQLWQAMQDAGIAPDQPPKGATDTEMMSIPWSPEIEQAVCPECRSRAATHDSAILTRCTCCGFTGKFDAFLTPPEFTEDDFQCEQT